MINTNKLFKINANGQVVRITTDDIPEGESNKYCLNRGKAIGDIFVRPAPDEVHGCQLLDGSLVYSYNNASFYEWVTACQQKAVEGDTEYDFFNKTEEEYTA